MKHSTCRITRKITCEGITRQGINSRAFSESPLKRTKFQDLRTPGQKPGFCVNLATINPRFFVETGFFCGSPKFIYSVHLSGLRLLARKFISGRAVEVFPLYFFLVTLLTSCDSVVSAAKDILATPETPVASIPPPKNTSKTANNTRFSALEQAIHQKINQYRQSQNLPPLTLDPRISEQARIHSQAMASGKATFSHDGFEKRVDAIAKSIPYRSAGENLAYNQGYRDPVDQAVEGWLNSPGHYKNIVGDFDVTGVGVVKTPQGRYYFSQIFIRRAKYGIF